MKTVLLLPRVVLGAVAGLAALLPALHYAATRIYVSADGSQENLPEPRLSVDRPERDVGEIIAGQRAEVSFKVHNTGGRRLILHKLNGGCECLSAEAELIVEPGEIGTIMAQLDSPAFGALRIELKYRTNDPHQPLLTLVCTASVKQ